MKTFIINNATNKKYYQKQFTDSNEARHWIINNLDLSLGWSVSLLDTINQ